MNRPPLFGTNTRWCPVCGQWVPCPGGRSQLDRHINREHPDAWMRQNLVRREMREGVK